jgi:putative acetyltransferase
LGERQAVTVEYRRASPADAEGLAQLMADPRVFGGLLQLPYPSVEVWRKRLEGQLEQSDTLHLVALADGAVIGNAGLFRTSQSLRTRHVAGLGISVAHDWQRRGVGSELMRRLLDWAENWAGYLRIELGVFTDNEPAMALYRKFGFVHEGTQRAFALRDGRYVDCHMMARLHPNPPQLP